MEKNRIDLLESFGVCSEILRFFGYAHNSFLLMTKLNKKTREVLDFNYEAIINCLEENKIDVCFNRHNTSMMLLPFDLFNFDIYLDCDEITECFIEIINAIRMKKGCYFKEHFMHENLCIYDIRVGVEQTKLLYSYNEEFKLIKTRKCCDIKHSNFTDSSYLSEDFVLIIDDIYRSLDEIIKYLRCLNKGHDTQLNSTLYSFTKINNFSFRTSLFESSIAKLEDIKNLNLSFNYLCIKGQSEDEIEKLTNPHYFKNRVKNINYRFEEDHNLSDLFFSNIKEINLKLLEFSSYRNCYANYDVIRILKNIPQNLSLNFYYAYYPNYCELVFTDAQMIIYQSGHESPLYIKCKKFLCGVCIKNINKDYEFIISNEKNGNKQIFLNIKKMSSACFSNIEIINEKKTIEDIYSDFPKDIASSEINFVVSLNSLNSVCICIDEVSKLDSKKFGILLQYISKTKSSSLSMQFPFCHKIIDTLAKLLPENCSYSFIGYSSVNEEEQLECIQKLRDDNIQSRLSNLILSDIIIIYQLSKHEFSYICEILEFQNIKRNLSSVDLILSTLSEALEIVHLLSACENISRICLKYTSPGDIEDIKEAIKKAKLEFVSKAGIISELQILKDE